MKLITKQCVPFMTYGCCNWSINNEYKRQVNVCFNRAIRRVFKYKDCETVRNLMFGFKILPMGFYFI